jgi:hypothetical protein
MFGCRPRVGITLKFKRYIIFVCRKCFSSVVRNFLRISCKVNYFCAGVVSPFYAVAVLGVRRCIWARFAAVRLAMDESPVSMFLFSKLL